MAESSAARRDVSPAEPACRERVRDSRTLSHELRSPRLMRSRVVVRASLEHYILRFRPYFLSTFLGTRYDCASA